MVQVGIDKMSFFTPHLFLDMVDLANARGVEPGKYLVGIGQTQQAVVPTSQDPVTLAANAAHQLLTPAERAEITEVIVATESGVDQSKSVAVYVQHLLGINRYARTIEMKQACYAGTYALMRAKDYVQLHPEAKVLVIATDIARYGLGTGGEVTQGAGAVAMLVTADPKVAVLEDDSQFMSAELMDFWRPNYADTARVDGKYSADVYRDFFKEIWARYRDVTGRQLADFSALLFHLPFTKMGLKALRDVLPETDEAHQEALLAAFEASRNYNQRVGNLYTGSAYLSLYSLLAHDQTLKAGDRLGLFSYGSGAEGEFFSMILQPDFKAGINAEAVTAMLDQRTQVDVPTYEALFNDHLHGDANRVIEAATDPAPFTLVGLKAEQRQYTSNN